MIEECFLLIQISCQPNTQVFFFNEGKGTCSSFMKVKMMFMGQKSVLKAMSAILF